MTDDRLKIWLGFWRWLISSVVITGGIAWATTIINAKHKDTELAIKVNQEEKAYLTSFLEKAMDENLEKRYRFAQYFANVTTSEDYKIGWENYLKTVEKELQSVKAEKEKLEARLSGISGAELDEAKDRIRELQRELGRSKRKRKTSLQSHYLDSYETLINYKLSCPDKSVKTIWSETVSASILPAFPEKSYYVTLGCRDIDGKEVGASVSWYPNGIIIQEVTVDGKILLYYPNGNKALEGTTNRDRGLPLKRWNLDGSLMD